MVRLGIASALPCSLGLLLPPWAFIFFPLLSSIAGKRADTPGGFEFRLTRLDYV